MRRLILTAIVGLCGLLAAVPASAQVVNSIQFGGGLFSPRGLDARDPDDVLVRDYVGQALPAFPNLTDALAFNISDFRGGHVFGEWDIAFGDHVELGAGIGFYRKAVPTVYFDLVAPSGREIEQTLRLQMVPLTALVRFLPFGRAGDVQPYVGAGLSMVNFRYSEVGDFVDPVTQEIFNDRFTTSGAAPGAVLLGGLRVPVGGDIYGLGIEGRYQFATGDTGGGTKGFLADKIDLSGFQLNFSFLVRF